MIEVALRCGFTQLFGRQIYVVSGMSSHFVSLTQEPEVYRSALRQMCRPGILTLPSTAQNYISLHVRLGDFQRIEARDDLFVLEHNNQCTPMWWYVDVVHRIRQQGVSIPIIVCSDGNDDELLALTELDGVSRAPGLNAVDDILTLAGACAVVGSRSTFTAWGAFLGENALLVAKGGNSYRPHSQVWEFWSESEFNEWLSAATKQASP